jgi:hypothetical protein
MSRVGFETTTPVFERAKILHALDCTVAVMGTDMDTKALRFLILLTVNQKQSDPRVSSTRR